MVYTKNIPNICIYYIYNTIPRRLKEITFYILFEWEGERRPLNDFYIRGVLIVNAPPEENVWRRLRAQRRLTEYNVTPKGFSLSSSILRVSSKQGGGGDDNDDERRRLLFSFLIIIRVLSL